ncbi:MAG: TonB-dependent receptor [Chlorobiales bacterium]|jgi:iron complex outermembrane recepter protein|nr:TonB-dependent receptor [Chlorobiales bacterium]
MNKVVLLISLLFLLPGLGLADTGGSATIKGLVKDASTSEPLPGATVMIQEMTLGAASDLDGNYTIRHVPAGSFVVKFSAVGYKGVQRKIEVRDNEVLELNINLSQGSIMGSEVVISASRYEQNKVELPITTSVVSMQAIEAQPVRQLDQVLETVPGVDMVRSGGFGSSTVQIRGSNTFSGGGLGTRVLLLYDGYPLNSPDAGSLYWSMISMNAIERIEIVKNSGSALYGAGAMGGVISAIAALPSEFTFKARFQNGIYDPPSNSETNTSVYPGSKTLYFYNAEIEHGNKIGDLRYNLVYSHSNDDGYRAAAEMTSNDIKFKARYDFTGTQYLQLTGMLSYVTGGIPYPWYDRQNALANPVDFKFDDDIKDNTMQMVGLTHVATLSNTVSLESKLYLNRSYWLIKYYPKYSSVYDKTDSQGNVIDNFQRYLSGDRHVYDPNDPSTYNDSDARRYGGGSQINIFSGGHRLIAGVDARYDDVISTMYHNNTAYGIGAFVQDDFNVTDKLRLSFGARFDMDHIDRSSITYKNYLNVTGVDANYQPVYEQKTTDITYQTLSQFSPRAAATYMFDAETSIRASVGRSMRAPTLAERFVTDAGFFKGIPNGELKAERLTSAEIGVFKSFSRYFSLDVSAYWNEYNDLIESENVNPDQYGDIVFQFKNVSKARILGVEISLNSQPIDELTVQVGYNFMDAKDISSNSDRRLGGNLNPTDGKDWLSYRPQHNFNFNASFTYSGLFLNYSGRYVSEIKSVRMYANPLGTDYPGNFFVMNAGAKYTVFTGLNLTAAVRNIGNVQYEELEHYRAPGRSFHFGFEYAY